MILETIYNYAPIWAQNLMCSVKGWCIRRRRFGKGFFRELDRLEKRQIDPKVELKSFLSAARNVPAYNDVFCRLEREGRDEPQLDDFPIINKSYVRAHYKDFISSSYTGHTLCVHTSGTTGTSLVVPQSTGFEQRQWAVWWRYRQELGIKYGTWYGWFGCGEMIVPIRQDGPPYWRTDFAGHRVMFGTYHLNIGNVELYVAEISRRGLIWLHGNASRLRYLSRLIAEKNLPPVRSVKFVTTASENLSPMVVTEIQRAFPNALVRNHYGMTEGVANFSQTIDGNWRIDDDFAHVELIPIDKSHPERCRIVGTNFSNPVFPLIRYDIGDVAIVKWQGNKPIVLGIEGRINECITLDNGMLVNSLLSYDIFGEAHNVREAQVRVLNGHAIELVIVKANSYSKSDEWEILRTARKFLKDDISVTFRYADTIPRSLSGKFQAIVNLVAKT